MSAPMVAPAPAPDVAPSLYRSVVSHEVVHRDDLSECPAGCEDGEISYHYRHRIDDHGASRLYVEIETCPTCRGRGLVLQVPAHGTFVPEPVEPLAGPRG